MQTFLEQFNKSYPINIAAPVLMGIHQNLKKHLKILQELCFSTQKVTMEII